MKKGIVIILIAAFVASMLTACGKSAKATASPAESATDEPTVVVTHPVVADEELTIPIGKDEEEYDPEAGKPALEDPNSLPAPPAEESTTDISVESESIVTNIDELRHEYPDMVFYTYEDYVGTDWQGTNWQDINIVGPGPVGHIAKDEYGLPVQDEFWLNDGSFDGVGYLLCCGAKHVGISTGFIQAYFGGIHTTTYGTTDEFPLLTISSENNSTTSTIAFFNFEISVSSGTGNGITSFYDTNKYPPQNYPIDTTAIQQLRGLLYSYKNCDLYATNCPLDGMNIPHHTTSRDGNTFICKEQ